MCCGDLFLALIAILFPPIAVWVKSGLCSADSLINILLCMLGYFPGLIHAWYIIAKHPEQDYDYEPINNRRDPERGGERVTYYYVSNSGSGGRRQYGSTAQSRQPQQVPQQGRPGPRQPGHQQQPQRQQEGVVALPGGSGGGSSSSHRPVDDGAPPPPYSEAVRGDHKMQTQD